jgi:hypothetical protein
VAVLLRRQLGLGHHAYDVRAGVGAARPLEVPVAAIPGAQLVRRPRRQHRRELRLLPGIHGRRGRLFRAPEAAREILAQRLQQRGPRLLAAAREPVLADVARQAHRRRRRAQDGISRGERHRQRHQQNVERELDAPRRDHQQHVARVVAGEERHAHRDGEEDDDPGSAFADCAIYNTESQRTPKQRRIRPWIPSSFSV